MRKILCEKCGVLIGSNVIKRHTEKCEGKIKKRYTSWTCECGRDFENLQSMRAHFRWCLIHRGGVPPIHNTKGKTLSTKGKSYEEIYGVEVADSKKAKISEYVRNRPPIVYTEEMRRRASESRTRYLENSPHIQWFKLSNGIRVQGMWEYNVGEILLKQGFSVTRPKLLYDGHRQYTPDFYIGGGVYVEVKGWLSNNNISKYQRVFLDNDVKIFLIRNEKGHNNYSRFIAGEISLLECEDLKTVVMGG